MALSTASLQRNLSRMELALAVIVITVLVGVFMSRMHTVEVAAEEAVVTARFQDMQARLMTLRLSFLGGAERPDTDAVVRHLGRGEIRFFERARDIDWEVVAPGEWVFARDAGIIAYRTVAGADVTGASGEPPRVRFKLEAGAAAAQSAGPETRAAAAGPRLLRLDAHEATASGI